MIHDICHVITNVHHELPRVNGRAGIFPEGNEALVEMGTKLDQRLKRRMRRHGYQPNRRKVLISSKKYDKKPTHPWTAH
jgi:hypothetical protein